MTIARPKTRLSATEPRESGSIEKMIDRAAGARAIPGNAVRLLNDGPECYQAMFDLIAGARRWIHFENYIIRSDHTGWRFAEALAQRARDGVKVRVIYDWIGSIATRRKYWKFLRAAGVEVRCHNPPKFLDAFLNLNRDHRKLVASDGIAGITGGLCIGDEWMGNDKKGIQPWRDTAIEITGPAALALDQSFLRLWTRTGGTIVEEAQAPERVEDPDGASVRVIEGRPGRERAYKVLELLAASSVRRLWITDAYMVPPPRLFQAFVDAARDGVDIRMLVPGSSDVTVVRNMTRVGYRDLLRAGIRIFEWQGSMLHGKTIVADGCWTRVGTSNLNASSLLGNYELDVMIEDPTLAHRMEEQYRRDIARSSEIVRGKPRAPERFHKMLPATLARQRPEEVGPGHVRTRREVRRRAMVAVWTVVTGARRSLFGPAALILIALGGLFLVLPEVMAYIFGAGCVWLAAAATREALRRRGQ